MDVIVWRRLDLGLEIERCDLGVELFKLVPTVRVCFSDPARTQVSESINQELDVLPLHAKTVGHAAVCNRARQQFVRRPDWCAAPLDDREWQASGYRERGV